MSLPRSLLLAALNALLYCAFCRQVKIFRMVVGYYPNIALPRKFHEKMLWRKIFDHNPLFVVFCDKLATKDYVRHKLPDIAIPETLWSGRHLGNAPEELFQRSVVIKANHASSYNHFTDTRGCDPASVNSLAEGWLKVTYGQRLLEWGYLGARKLLLIEEQVPADRGGRLLDLGIRCADGRVINVYVFLDHKSAQQKLGIFHCDGSPLVFEHDVESIEYGPLPKDFRLPGTFSEAVRLAGKLSQGVDFARFDFLTDGETLYAGEITVYPSAGLTKASPEGRLGHDTIVNPHWDLRKSWFLSTPQTGWRGLYARLLDREMEGGRA